jgi:organic radical activating enzyme
MFDIEITTRCDKLCDICPRQNFARQNRDMSLEILEKICNWLPKNSDIFFAGFGEPLQHKNHMVFLEKLHKENFRTSIMTNGKLLSYNKICELYESGLYKLQISILLKYEKSEIAKFVNIIDSKFYSKTQFNLLYDETIEKPVSLVNNLEEMGFKIQFKHIHNRGGELYKNEYEYTKRLPCGTFRDVTYIDTNGSIQICSNDINGKYNLGHIETMTFEELMNKKHNLNETGEIAPICKECDDEYRGIHLQKQGEKYG